MLGIYSFQVDKAEASVDNGRMTVRLTYPNNPQVEVKRMPEQLDRGIEVFNNLLKDGYSTIGPIKPASSGSLYMFKDGKLLVHRRNKGARTHPNWHSAYAGFAATEDHVYTAEGIRQNGLRESSEEVLLITRDRKPWIITPSDSVEYVSESAKRLGIDHLRLRKVDVETLDTKDRLEVYDEGGNQLFSLDADLEFLYESLTSLNAMWIRKFPLRSEEVLPIDSEGVMDGGKFLHFDRESYFLDPAEISGNSFGSVLKNPDAYKTKFVEVNGLRMPVPVLQTRDMFQEPYLGPENAEVIDPFIFAPEDLLRKTLDRLGVVGYTGDNNWMKWELWVEQSKKEGKPLLPDAVLANKPKGNVVPFEKNGTK